MHTLQPSFKYTCYYDVTNLLKLNSFIFSDFLNVLFLQNEAKNTVMGSSDWGDDDDWD